MWLRVIYSTQTHTDTHSAPSRKLLFGVAEENQTSLTGSKMARFTIKNKKTTTQNTRERKMCFLNLNANHLHSDQTVSLPSSIFVS